MGDKVYCVKPRDSFSLHSWALGGRNARNLGNLELAEEEEENIRGGRGPSSKGIFFGGRGSSLENSFGKEEGGKWILSPQ